MTPTTGTCPRCRVQRTLVDGLIDTHRMSGANDPRVGPCQGSSKRPIEFTERARATRDRRLAAQVEAARDYAAVALDAVLAGRHDMNAELPKLLKLAAALGRLTWPAKASNRNSVARTTRYWSTPFSADFRAGSGWPGAYRTADVYCTFCGELILGDVDKQRIGDGGIDSRTRHHTTPCALQCLAGLRVPVAPGTRRIPEALRPDEEQRA